MDRPNFTIEEGIKMQDEHLAEWKLKLKEEVYNFLFLRAKRDNGNAKDGYDIFRGQDILNFVINYKPMKLWRYTNSTETIWCSFDTGEVEAYDYKEAKQKAIAQIEKDLKEVNELLKGHTIEMNLYEIEVEDITHEKRD